MARRFIFQSTSQQVQHPTFPSYPISRREHRVCRLSPRVPWSPWIHQGRSQRLSSRTWVRPSSPTLVKLSIKIDFSLWHSRRLAAPNEYQAPTEHEKTAKPPAYHKIVQKAPDGDEVVHNPHSLKSSNMEHRLFSSLLMRLALWEGQMQKDSSS
jgi:hypothetical protein